MLDTRAAVPLHEVVDLPALAGGVRLDQRQRDQLRRALHDLREHALVADLDVLLEDLLESEDLAVVPHGLVELTRRHAHREVIDHVQQVLTDSVHFGHPEHAGQELGPRSGALDEAVRDVTERAHLRGRHGRIALGIAGRRGHRCRAPLDILLERRLGVVDLDRDHPDAVTVPAQELRRRVVGDQRRGQDHADVALGEQQRPLPLEPGLRAALALKPEPERGAVVERGLSRVPDVKLDVVYS